MTNKTSASNSTSLDNMNTNSSLALIVAQMAHDIRSPVSVLNMIASGHLENDAETQGMVQHATSRINDIANNLLMKFRGKQCEVNLQHSLYSLIDNIQKIISEKRILYSAVAVKFKFNIYPDIHSGTINYQVSDFMRVISNILNNAVESLVGDGVIEVNLTTNNTHVLIEIIDNGSGMSTEALHKVFRQGETTKENGFGLGLPHAKLVLKSLGGECAIRSKINVGTAITLSLPMIH